MTVLKSFMGRLKTASLTSQTSVSLQANGTSQKWDNSAIDLVYEQLIDHVGLVLDKLQLLGFRPLFNTIPALKYFCQLFELMENELLIQWKLKSERSLSVVFDRQKKWLSSELRVEDGFFPVWNQFYRGLLEFLGNRESIILRDPWKSLVLSTLADDTGMNDLKGVVATSRKDQLLKEVSSFFELLYNSSPHHIAVSFLNLIELGTGERPNIADPGEVSISVDEQKLSTPVQSLLSRVISHNDWADMPNRLFDYWKNPGSDLP